jgi:acyl-CoA reductase-like NAD-dependent aldehyde dehydrogenase
LNAGIIYVNGIGPDAGTPFGGPELPNGMNKGYFIKPTIFTDVTNDMRIAKEEIFGPVLSIIPFETEEEAIKIVNDTEYGLGNYLQTEDKEKAKRVSRKLNAGIIYVNGIGPDAGTPFGGPELPNGMNKGYFIKPTIFTDVTNDMRIAKEEIFGPVLSIIPFETEEEAIKIVNDTEYGLGNYLQTEDKEKAKRVSRKLNAGIIYVNGIGPDAGTPFGGFKQSGNGREGGVWGLEEYLEVKTVTDWKE